MSIGKIKKLIYFSICDIILKKKGGEPVNKSLKAASVFMYACAAVMTVAYFYLDITVTLRAHVRLVMLALICALGYFAGLLFAKKEPKESAERIMKATFFAFFLLYVHLLLTLVLFDKYFGRNGFSALLNITWEELVLHIKESTNLIPFKSLVCFFDGIVDGSVSIRAFVVNIFVNIAAFVQFAFFMPLLFKKMRSLNSFLIFILSTVCEVEILQLLLFTGLCDIDDLILNSLGACAAYALLHTKFLKPIVEKITLIKY